MKNYCLYYQARVEPSTTWFFTGVLRSFEHLCFDRTLNVQESIFEFFVPQEQEKYFIEVLEYFVKNKMVFDLTKLPNRLLLPDQTV
ncbi:MAG TPA: hypothetical protein VJ201_00125 [Candidatus Babeliales bacterium]|nr:hypothetical protein [Candidatus Babeliales bacterium]